MHAEKIAGKQGGLMRIFQSCKAASELITLAQDGPLAPMDNLRLRIHLSICGNCRNVKAQLELISDMLRNSIKFDDSPTHELPRIEVSGDPQDSRN
jgi:predicted anti-sigma-YlaC factor YlaD